MREQTEACIIFVLNFVSEKAEELTIVVNVEKDRSLLMYWGIFKHQYCTLAYSAII